jgi:hypothetical protein
LPKQLQKAAYLGAGAVPVLGGEAEKRQVGNTAFGQLPDTVSGAFQSGTVAFKAGQAATLCPAAVAVHYYSHVVGKMSRFCHNLLLRKVA